MDMDSEKEFEYTRNQRFQGNISTTQNIEAILLDDAKNIANKAGYFNIDTKYVHQFFEESELVKFTIESDILDVSIDKIAIENYIYIANSSKFVAKAFFVFTK